MSKKIKTRKVIFALKRLGFVEIRQNGSHIIFENKNGVLTIIPNHYEIGVGLLLKIIKKDLKITKKEFFDLLD